MKDEQKLLGEDGVTARGFPYVKFKDESNIGCSIQISSRCETPENPLGYLWLGVNELMPSIRKCDAHKFGIELPDGDQTGWMPFPLPKEVLMHQRMHLDEDQVRGLIKRLTCWLTYGDLKPPSRHN